MSSLIFVLALVGGMSTLNDAQELVTMKKASAPKTVALAPSPALTELVSSTEATLPNGLRVRIFPDRSMPIISLQIFYRVGSRNERQGMTGISHLFEHMMFNGAKKYGPKQFDRVLESRGGTSNAYTGHDFTAYEDAFPADALEQVLDLESDRMRSLQISARMLSSEREVVKEERRAVVDNSIVGVMHEELETLAYKAHPYRWPIIGWPGDLERITQEECQAFFRTYYAPNNATLYLVGDVEPKKALALIKKFFGGIRKGPPAPAVAEDEPEQQGERRAWVRKPAQAPSLLIGYRAPDAKHPDTPVLDVIQFALTVGDGSRLNRSLVFEKELAVSVHVDWTWRLGPGLFNIFLELRPGTKPDEVEQALYAELERVASEGLEPRELERAQNNLRAQLLRELSSTARRADVLGNYEMLLGSWKAGLAMTDAYGQVTSDKVKSAARQYLTAQRRSVVTLLPAQGSP